MRYFITHTTENYEDITLQLAKSINKYSKYKLIVYTIDYDGSELLKSVAITKRIDLNLPIANANDFMEKFGITYVYRNSVRTFLALGGKIDAMIDACNSGIDEWVYIDSDSIVNTNVDDLFDYCNEIETFPLASKGPYDYILLTHPDGSIEGNPFWQNNNVTDLESTLEWPMMKFFCMTPQQRGTYHTTNILVGNKNVKPFLEIWRDCKNLFPKITNTYKISPLQEETIYNVLTWQIKDIGLPMVYINVKGSDTVKHFLENETNQDIFVSEYYKLPKEKQLIKVFHGEKRMDEIDNIFNLIDTTTRKKLKILFVAPHLSTGGMPSFLLKRIKSLNQHSKDIEIFVVEFTNYSSTYVVHRKQIIDLVGENRFWSLGKDKFELIDIIKNNNIDIVHIDEMIEGFDSFNQVPPYLMELLYSNDRSWRIVETCHNVWFNPNETKLYNPDGYLFCTPWHLENTFTKMISPKELSLFPIENLKVTNEERINCKNILKLDLNKKHVLNIGLWTSGKNQGEGIEIARKLINTNPEIQFHFVGNQAINFESYWKPLMDNLPSNVTIWNERNDIDTFLKASDIFMFNSTWECNPIVLREAISYGLPILARNLTQYMDMFTPYITPINSDIDDTSTKLVNLIYNTINYSLPENDVKNFAETHVNFYNKIIKNEPEKQFENPKKPQFIFHCVDNPYFEIKSEIDKEFNVKIYDDKFNLHYEETIKSNTWIKLNREYYTKWNIKVFDGDMLIYKESLNYTNKRVFISFDSHSLGDTIAWIPYCLEFKKKHNCDVIVACKWIEYFKDVYPELEFVPPGSTVHNIMGMYKLGWFWNSDKEPEICNTIPLQKSVTNILGLDFTEIKPRINFTPKENPYTSKYITIATHSTSGLKYWNNPTGWQELIDYLILKGYKIISVSKEKCDLKHVEHLEDTSITNTMNVIHHSEFFIGLSSGLSWLSWAIGKHVVMISNFTEKNHEFTSNCTRIVKLDVCNSCWNNPMFKFDKGDWNWCPEHKDTERQFECHKSITSQMVINSIQHLLINNN
jgi:autotransporter strand-loop-strand O-heptosyltransferase